MPALACYLHSHQNLREQWSAILCQKMRAWLKGQEELGWPLLAPCGFSRTGDQWGDSWSQGACAKEAGLHEPLHSSFPFAC